jgi:exo-beta-1,3-glucanase (GH17 family)
MWSRSSAHVRLLIASLIGLGLSWLLLTSLDSSADADALPLQAGTIINLVPDQMTLTGHVATQSNTVGQCTEPWLSGTPGGTIILGVNPASCDPAAWNGGAATTQVFLPNVYSSTVYVLKLSWPDRDGKGLHSPQRNRTATITFDGRTVWEKRTVHFGTFGDYYAAQHGPIVTTLVVTQSLTHTLAISVPARTAWDVSQIELRASAYPSAIRGIGYSPYHDCQYPGSPLPVPTTTNLRDDLFRLFHTTNAIRTYSATGVNGQVPALANALGLPVYAGAWLDKIPQDAIEIQALINLAQTTSLEGVIVGNEYYLRHRSEQDLADLRQQMQLVKSSIPVTVPMTTAEIDSLMFDWDAVNIYSPTIKPAYRPILDTADFVMVHIYPFWNGMPIDGAAEFTVKRYQAIQQLMNQEYPGQNKRVIIGETGWPSGGGAIGQAVPSHINQERYLREFIALAEAANVDYLYFDAIDELWKIEEPGHVGQNWGYSYSDRTAKHDFYGMLIPADQLPPQVPLPTTPYLIYLPSVSTTARRTFTVYDEWPEGPGKFIPSGWMGDLGNISFYGCDRSNPHGGEMAIRTSFLRGGPLGWGGIYWQYPENNWGNNPGGINLTGATRVTFWARSDTPNARVTFIVGGIGYTNGTDCAHPLVSYPDSICPKIQLDVTLSSTWTKYTIDLHQSPVRDLSRVVGGFGWVTNTSVTFYLDDIVYEFD